MSEFLLFSYKYGVCSSVREFIILCILKQAVISKFLYGEDLRGRRIPRAILGFEFIAIVLAFGVSSLSYSKVEVLRTTRSMIGHSGRLPRRA